MIILRAIWLIFAGIILFSCKEKEKADLIVYNGILYTADSALHEATAFAIKDGKFLAVGSDSAVLAYKGPQTELKDARQRFIMPGLNEGHAHLLSLGNTLMTLDLLDVSSWPDLLRQVKNIADSLPPGSWIEGRGWHQDKWKSDRLNTFNGYPYHHELSAVTPDHPVILTHASGHALLANQRAMDLAGITRESMSPAGGRIVRDAAGNLLGIFEENAMDIIQQAYKSALDAMPDSTKLEREAQKLELACQKALDYGITSLQDAGSSLEQIRWLHKMSEQGKIPIRLNVMLYEDIDKVFGKLDSLPIKSHDPERFRAASVKAYMDGALGSYGAWLFEDYHDNPGVKGQTLIPLESMDSLAASALKKGLQLCVHAIGDRANHEVLNIFKKRGVTPHNRWRIEHAQHVDPRDISVFRDLGVIASMQAIHCTSDAPFVERRLGMERASSGAYVWRSMVSSGVHFANGTDAPVERINPFDCIYATVTRKRPESDFEFYPDQKLTRNEALLSYTLWNAYASFEDHMKGSISPGKLADFVILNQNLMKCRDEDILNAKAEEVYIGGKKIR